MSAVFVEVDNIEELQDLLSGIDQANICDDIKQMKTKDGS